MESGNLPASLCLDLQPNIPWAGRSNRRA